MVQEQTPVLIVGGSLVGLTSALLLGDLGVPSLVVERHPGTAIHARAGHFQLGTTEMLRQVGLERTVREASAKTYHPIGGIIAVESLAGKQLATFVKELNEGVEGFSPTVRVFIDQDVLEPILRERAVALGATVRNRVEATALEQDDDGATVTLHDLESDEEHTVRARYVIAADGNRSPMRTRLGIGMEGHGILSNSITIYFRADCTPLLEDRHESVIYVHNPELRGFFRLDRAGKAGFLVINSVGADVTTDEAVNVGDGITEERAAAMLQTAIGTPDIAAEVLQIVHWRAEANCATRMRDGRVFLAGDAAHVVPPNGGYGGNMGILDARNLAWKLAAVIRGQAGTGLLDTYEAERRPLSELTVEQAYTRYATRVVPERGTDDAEPFIDDLTMEIGLVMNSNAVIGGANDGARYMPAAETRGRPGTRAPHVALGPDRSTLDLFGRSFVLLRAAGDDWAPPGVEAHVIDSDGFLEAYGITRDGATLIRPDGIVGWRSTGAFAHDELTAALNSILALDVTPPVA
ncbi:MAG TPA: FAD-dependent monooxygenase [Ilumatobacteraceae bacterium]|nr:FAD-dependent monooxygenase [Ilumatobacteraceae bacterium]